MVSRSPARWAPLALVPFLSLVPLLSLSACAVDPTEVVVVVTSDLAVPSDIDRVEIVVTAPDGEVRTANATFGPGEPGFPRTLGVPHPGGPLGTFRVVARAFRGPSLVLSRVAELSFRKDERLELRLPLLAECVDVLCTCTATFCSTCVEGGLCTTARVTPPRFDGQVNVRLSLDGYEDEAYGAGGEAQVDGGPLLP